MVTKFSNTIKENGMLRCGERVLCALSGGADSSVLLHMLVSVADELGISVCAAHLNHMLRGEEADNDEEFVKRKCDELKIPLICERIDVLSLAEASGESTELAARNARYDFLRRAKENLGADKIATAHNANDNLETILFNISRGGGIDGICGIPPVRNDIIRPLIEISRSEIEKYAEKNQIAFCVDKTNSETVYSRNKLRHNAIPALVEVNGSAVENAVRSSKILRRESEFLMSMAKNAADEIAVGECSCDRIKLSAVHDALFARVCEIYARKAMGNEAYTLEYCHIQSIRKLCASNNPSKQINLPSGLLVRCQYDALVFEKQNFPDEIFTKEMTEGSFDFGKYTISVEKTQKNGKVNNSVNTFCVPCDKIIGSLVVRKRKQGDELRLPKCPRKSLKKLFIDKRIPKTERDMIPVLADDEKVIAVYGFGQDERVVAQDNEDIWLVKIALRRDLHHRK